MKKFYTFAALALMSATVSLADQPKEVESLTKCEDGGSWEDAVRDLLGAVSSGVVYSTNDPLNDSDQPQQTLLIRAPFKVTDVKWVVRPGRASRVCATFHRQSFSSPE